MKHWHWHFHGGLHLQGNKEMSMGEPVQHAGLPTQLILPLQQHIGAPAEPMVRVGDKVLKGQMIAYASGYVSAPIHASSSGTVTAIEERPVTHPSGMSAPCIIIATDGQETWCESTSYFDTYHTLEPSALRNVIRDAGIVGLGGAGFPAFVKLNPGPGKLVDTLILNGAECEPYISCDAMLMQQRPRDIIDGLLIMRHAVQARHCIIGIEDNKPAAIQALQEALTEEESAFTRIVKVPTIYPTGGEKQLIKVLTGKEIPTHKLPVDIGMVCHNVGTAAAVADAVLRGRPLISRYVTLTGEASGRPCNREVLFGTTVRDLLPQGEIDQSRALQLIVGGPMMGFTLQDLDAPVIKTTNCLLALPEEEQKASPPVLPCIRCGECMRVCPAQLLPQQLYWYAKARDFDKVQDYQLFDCIECGCCAYVCPSHIPLVQYYRFAKTEIWDREREKKKSDHARERHEFHLYRLERKKQEDEERKRKKRELLKKTGEQQDDGKQDAIKAALARVQAKKSAQSTAPKNTENLTAAQKQTIAEIDKRRGTEASAQPSGNKDNK